MRRSKPATIRDAPPSAGSALATAAPLQCIACMDTPVSPHRLPACQAPPAPRSKSSPLKPVIRPRVPSFLRAAARWTSSAVRCASYAATSSMRRSKPVTIRDLTCCSSVRAATRPDLLDGTGRVSACAPAAPTTSDTLVVLADPSPRSRLRNTPPALTYAPVSRLPAAVSTDGRQPERRGAPSKSSAPRLVMPRSPPDDVPPVEVDPRA